MPLSLEASSPDEQNSREMEAEPMVLARKIDSREATALLHTFRDRRGAPLTIDAGFTEYVGGQGVALLLSAAKSWHTDNQSLEFANPSDDFIRDLALYGLTVDDINVEVGL
ncbi:MAG: STAS domain-containing protein [Pseudomonadota bacterium]